MFMKTIKHYLTPEGRDLYMEYLKSLRDSIAKAKYHQELTELLRETLGIISLAAKASGNFV